MNVNMTDQVLEPGCDAPRDRPAEEVEDPAGEGARRADTDADVGMAVGDADGAAVAASRDRQVDVVSVNTEVSTETDTAKQTIV